MSSYIRKSIHFLNVTVFALSAHVCQLSSYAASRPGSAPSVAIRILAVTNPVTGLFYDLDNKPVELSASPGMLSPVYNYPASSHLSIYKYVQGSDKTIPPRRVIVAEANIGEAGPYLMLLNLPDDSAAVGLSVLDDSWTVHPAEVIRVLNLSKRHIAVQLGKFQKEIKSGQSEFFQKNGSSTVIKLKTAALEEGSWTLRTQLPQAIYPYCRQMFLIQDSTPSPENPNPMELNVYNVIDTSPAPEQGVK